MASTIPAECALEVATDFTLGWHIGAIFLILLASSLGVAFPLILKDKRDQPFFKTLFVLGKHTGTGVLLSLGFIHLLAPAMDQLGSPCIGAPFTEYPFALLFAMISAMLMHVVETFAHSYIHNKSHKNGEGHDHDVSDEEKFNETDDDMGKLEHGETKHKSYQHADHSNEGLVEKKEIPKGHTHSVLIHSTEEEAVSAFLLEFGLAAHSIIIGLAVGVAQDSELSVLIPALCFHQMFEGIALGSQLADIGIKSWKERVLACIYAFSAPTGIAIGIGVQSSFNSAAGTTNLVQGILDAIAAGIILYSAFVTLIAMEFATDYHEMKGNGTKFAMFACMWVGAGVMAVIGLWL